MSFYKTKKAKFNGVADEIWERYQTGQPMLVGTASIKDSEALSEVLNARNIPHKVLNAKHHAEEAAIIAEGGQRGSVIIATNMAGRGVDIKLGDAKRTYEAAGRVVDDETGNPVAGSAIACIQLKSTDESAITAGTGSKEFFGNTKADNQGNFRLVGLAPGQYLLSLGDYESLLTGSGSYHYSDGAKLESLLSAGQIDRVEVVVPFSRTNVLTGAAARQYVLLFRATNRIAEPDRTKAQVSTEVSLMSGTNDVGWFTQFDNGLWNYGDYSFRLRTSP